MPRKKRIGSADQPVQNQLDALKSSRERILIRLVTAISRMCIVYATRSITHLGISTSQAIVLGEVFRHNGCRQEDLREHVALDKGNVTRALQRIEELGLVRRVHDPVDRRVVRVYCTNRALAIEREMYALAARWDDRLTHGFTHEERETLIDLLLRMEVNAKALKRTSEAPLDGTYL